MAYNNQHEWGFMANPTKTSNQVTDNGGARLFEAGDLAYCPLCKQWQFGSGKKFKMTQEKYIQLHEDGFIDASEVLGYPSGEKKPLAQI